MGSEATAARGWAWGDSSHCVLVQQHTKKKEAVVLNMVQDSIVAVCLHACYHVRIGCIPGVSVSVLRCRFIYIYVYIYIYI